MKSNLSIGAAGNEGISLANHNISLGESKLDINSSAVSMSVAQHKSINITNITDLSMAKKIVVSADSALRLKKNDSSKVKPLAELEIHKGGTLTLESTLYVEHLVLSNGVTINNEEFLVVIGETDYVDI